MKKMNARLEWDGDVLLCNGVRIALVWKSASRTGIVWRDVWVADTFGHAAMRRATEQSARRAINRRFGLKEQP